MCRVSLSETWVSRKCGMVTAAMLQAACFPYCLSSCLHAWLHWNSAKRSEWILHVWIRVRFYQNLEKMRSMIDISWRISIKKESWNVCKKWHVQNTAKHGSIHKYHLLVQLNGRPADVLETQNTAWISGWKPSCQHYYCIQGHTLQDKCLENWKPTDAMIWELHLLLKFECETMVFDVQRIDLGWNM